MLLFQKRDIYLHRNNKSYYTTPAHSKPQKPEAAVQFSCSAQNYEEDLRVFWINAFCRVIRHILFHFFRLAMIVFYRIME